MLNPQQFTDLLLAPALKAIDMYSADAMHLMLRTALVESRLTHIKQIPNGPALGLFQIEWDTYLDVCRYLSDRPSLRFAILDYTERLVLPKNPTSLIADISLNILIARIKYWMQPEPLPSHKDFISQANYYERYYNGNVYVEKTQEFIRCAAETEGWIDNGKQD